MTVGHPGDLSVNLEPWLTVGFRPIA
jgi:hypothetical protein